MKNAGGPAFPVPLGQGISTEGMSLRDWYAGQALAGIYANSEGLIEARRMAATKGRSAVEQIAVLAYGAADAMLAERAKEES